MVGGRKSTRRNMRRNKIVGGASPRPTFYVGLSRQPRAGTPAPYWTPIYGTSPGANATGLSCDVFSRKAYRFNDNGEPIGYPNESVGDCVDGFPEPAPEIQVGGAVPLPIYYAGLIPQPQGGYGPAPAYFHLGFYENENVVAEYHSGLVFQRSVNGVVSGYPNNPVGRWVDGLPPMGPQGGRRRTRRRRTHRR